MNEVRDTYGLHSQSGAKKLSKFPTTSTTPSEEIPKFAFRFPIMSPSNQCDVIEIAFHEAKPPLAPIVLLPQQLERMTLGVPAAVVFSFATELPDAFDSSNPPDGIDLDSRQAMLVDKFYKLQTKRECPVAEPYPDTGEKRRCVYSSSGFRDILTHQDLKHNRKCRYLCLLDNFLASFDKIGNAKRRFSAMHSEQASRRRRLEFEGRRADMAHKLTGARRAADNRRVSRRIAKKSTKAYLRNEKFIISLHCVVPTDIENGNICMLISPDTSSTESIAQFHQENITDGVFTGECQSQKQEEWIAVEGLLDMYYQPKTVEYEFMTQR